MCFVEFNWIADCYQFRIGDRFTDYRGTRSLPTLAEWQELLAHDGCKLIRVTSRTYKLVRCMEHEDPRSGLGA